MSPIKITYKNLKEIAQDITSKVVSNHICNVIQVTSVDFLLVFSFYRKQRLLISINHQSPFVGFINQNNQVSTKVGLVNDTLRKYLRDAIITEVKTINDDRVIEITTLKNDDFYQKKITYLIVELIPTRPNLILLDENRKIIFATHYTTLEANRLVMKNLIYKPIKKSKEIEINDPFNFDSYTASISEYFEHSLEKKKEENHRELYLFFKNRVKSLKKKILSLNKELEHAKKGDEYLDIGNTLLCYVNDETEAKKYIEENNIQYNPLLSLSSNAELYFKKYKKAKRAVEMAQSEIEVSNNLIKEFELILSSWAYYEEEELKEFESLYLKRKPNKKPVDLKKPSYVIVNNVKIAFGKNSKQNEYLTFKLARKDDTYLHIKDYHGSHVIIFSDNLNNELLLTASEIALLLSQKEEGSIIYTKVKNVKKTETSGKVTFTNYQEITLTKVRNETKELLLTAKRF